MVSSAYETRRVCCWMDDEQKKLGEREGDIRDAIVGV